PAASAAPAAPVAPRVGASLLEAQAGMVPPAGAPAPHPVGQAPTPGPNRPDSSAAQGRPELVLRHRTRFAPRALGRSGIGDSSGRGTPRADRWAVSDATCTLRPRPTCAVGRASET